MSDVQEQAGSVRKRRFDATEKDCFGPLINRSDNQVTTLVLETLSYLSQGEYDQDDVVAIPYDTLADLHTVAEELWRWVLNHRGQGEAVHEDHD